MARVLSRERKDINMINTNIDLNIIRGNKVNLNTENVPVIDGNLIITKDTGEIFIDFDNKRK